MFGNNPITRFDAQGLYGTVDWLDLPSAPDPSRVTRAVLALPGVQAAYDIFSQQAENFLAEVQQKTEQFNKLKPAQKNKQGDSDTYRPRSKELGDFNAYAAVYKIGKQEYEGGFVNLPASLGKKDTFNGIALQDKSYRINDKKAFMSAIESKYEEGSWLYKRDDDLNQSKRGDPKRINPLHTGIAHLTSLHIQHTERSRQGTLSTFPGVPALHAKVQAFNHALQNGTSMTDIVIFTKRLVGNKLGKAGDDFSACFNCDALLSLVHVTTGRTTADAAYAAAQEAKSSQILARKLEAQVGDLAVPHQTIWRAYRASLGRKAAPTA